MEQKVEQVKKEAIVAKIVELLKENNAVMIPYLDYQPTGIMPKIAIELKNESESKSE
jgi:predicted transcriptional regulator